MFGFLFRKNFPPPKTDDLPLYRIMRNGLNEYIVQELTHHFDGEYYYKTISEYLPSLRQAEEELGKAEKKRSWEVVTPTK